MYSLSTYTEIETLVHMFCMKHKIKMAPHHSNKDQNGSHRYICKQGRMTSNYVVRDEDIQNHGVDGVVSKMIADITWDFDIRQEGV